MEECHKQGLGEFEGKDPHRLVREGFLEEVRAELGRMQGRVT